MMMLRKWIEKYIRVLKVARKPTKEEYFRSLKVVFAGVAILGSIGFGVYLIFGLLRVFGI